MTCGLLAGLALLASVSPLQAVTLSDLNDKTFVWSRQWVEGTPTDDSDSEIIHLNANGTTQDWWNDDYDQFGNRLPPVSGRGTWSVIGNVLRLDNNPAGDLCECRRPVGEEEHGRLEQYQHHHPGTGRHR